MHHCRSCFRDEEKGSDDEAIQEDIEEGLIEIPVCECTVESDQAILQLLASSEADWVTLSSKDLWRNFASLQLQLRRIAEHPSMWILLWGSQVYGVANFYLTSINSPSLKMIGLHVRLKPSRLLCI